MKLRPEQVAIIDQYTDARLINREKLMLYLEKHKTVKNDVFKYCSTDSKHRFRIECGYCSYLDNEPMFIPVDREIFIKRVPFYFSMITTGAGRMSGLSLILPVRSNRDKADFDYEAFYDDLEWMFYDLHIPLDTIFDYARDQIVPSRSNRKTERNIDSAVAVIADSFIRDNDINSKKIFQQWRQYLHICIEHGWTDLTPLRFITAYNEALTMIGQDPIIYYPIETYSRYFKEARGLRCRGHFPCDKAGMPILKWTSIKVKNPAAIIYNAEKSQCGELEIKYGPKTLVYVLDDDADDEGELQWAQIYVGPLAMEFDHSALREYRREAKMTQNEIAAAIGTSVRTYQKWENGETTPDSNFLIRLMNWLAIDDVQQLSKVIDFPEEEEEKQ